MLIAGTIVVLGIVFWVLGRLGLKKQEENRHQKDYHPTVSIIIPSYSSTKTIMRCVESAKRIDYPKKEIMVVDNSKSDPTKMCRSLGVKCFHSERRLGKPKAMAFNFFKAFLGHNAFAGKV